MLLVRLTYSDPLLRLPDPAVLAATGKEEVQVKVKSEVKEEIKGHREVEEEREAATDHEPPPTVEEVVEEEEAEEVVEAAAPVVARTAPKFRPRIWTNN